MPRSACLLPVGADHGLKRLSAGLGVTGSPLTLMILKMPTPATFPPKYPKFLEKTEGGGDREMSRCDQAKP